MELIPAIDILDGQVVQLVRGNYDAPQVFPFTPGEAAHHWIESGATRLHVVNLSAARSGARDDDVLAEMVRQIDVPVQVSGGISDIETAAGLFDLGVRWVIFSTAAIQNPIVVHQAIREFGSERVIVGVVTKSGLVATDGWTTTAQLRAVDVITDMSEHGVTRFMYTDADRDGTRVGPGVSTLVELNRAAHGKLTVAGGMGNRQHLKTLADLGIESVVLGTSIYTGSIDFRAAVLEFRN